MVILKAKTVNKKKVTNYNNATERFTKLNKQSCLFATPYLFVKLTDQHEVVQSIS